MLAAYDAMRGSGLTIEADPKLMTAPRPLSSIEGSNILDMSDTERALIWGEIGVVNCYTLHNILGRAVTWRIGL